MKKIGIITFHSAENSGAALQCVALFKIFQVYGGDPFIIDYQPQYIRDQYKLFINPFIVHTSTGIRLRPIRTMLAYIKQDVLFYRKCIRKVKFANFRNKWMCLSKRYNTYEELCSDAPIADVYVAGSDQIWNKRLTGGHLDPAYFLRFGSDDIGKYGYAISIGSDPAKNSESILSMASCFDVISFREKSVYDYFFSLDTNNKMIHCVDPTLLLSSSEWKSYIHLTSIHQPYILVYALEKNDDFQTIVDNLISKKPDVKVVDISQCNLYLNNVKRMPGFSPSEFLGLINNAEYIITNSFHCTVFSILFHKVFTVIPHKKSNQRIVDLLSNVGLTYRIYDGLEPIHTDNNIDWDNVDQKIDDIKQESVSYIKHILE